MPKLDDYPIPDPAVVGRVMESDQPGEMEAVLVVPTRGKVKVLNEVGARIWQMIDGRRTVREIAAVICEEYEVERDEAEGDTIDFLDDLAERGLVSFADNPRP